ncbi:larval cuticle protein LCP-17-like [Pectinophora gossypiella]|uniref:larval cuticle protein LCP-17-like n=1 Tax=Pectinophora gossypiella TaxID=13191 RepID=UPI00214F4F79|nr:larval cuticle protein LCP-17-like [Pectinophora gossypiella]
MLCILLILVAISSSATTPVNPADDIVTKFENINDGSGNYYFRFETIYGLRREETGELVNAGQPDQHIEVHGEYSYEDPEGKLHVIKYTADENGYRFESKDKPSRPYFDPSQIVKCAVFICIGLLNILPSSTQQYTVDPTTFLYDNQGNGEYRFIMRTADGTEREESGNFEGEGNYIVKGYYSYYDPAGQKQYVSYYADNTGYHPTLMKKPLPGDVPYSSPLPQALAATLIG